MRCGFSLELMKFVDWLIEGSIEQSVSEPDIDWLIDQLIGWLFIDGLTGQLFGWLLIDRLVIDWLNGHSVVWFVYQLIDWSIDWLIDQLIGWFVDGLMDWFATAATRDQSAGEVGGGSRWCVGRRQCPQRLQRCRSASDLHAAVGRRWHQVQVSLLTDHFSGPGGAVGLVCVCVLAQ